MDQTVRIATADLEDGILVERMRALPLRPEVAVHAALFAVLTGLVAKPPDILVLGIRSETADLPGTLRTLRALMPTLGLILVAPAAQELSLAPTCARALVQLLPLPCSDGQLASAIERALENSDRPHEGMFLDLAHGFADAVNSPLLAITGQLQLLQIQLDPIVDANRRQILTTTLAQAARVQQIVDDVHLAARAAEGARNKKPVDLRAMLTAALSAIEAGQPPMPVTFEPDFEVFVIAGDSEFLQPAVSGLVRLAREIQQVSGPVRLSLSRFRTSIRMRLTIDSPGVPRWRLPRTFEPYYLNRLLRGTSHGLTLFLCQAVLHGHGGHATARRLADDGLAIDLLLPAD
ncbi:MAG: ATP-binding protein [Planctomycetota bacterium]